MTKPLLRDAAALLWAAEAYVLDFPGRPDVALAWAQASWQALERPGSLWENRRHDGDCTKRANPCMTCQVEKWERKAYDEFYEEGFEPTSDWRRP